MPKVEHTSNRVASRKLAAAASLITRAGAEISAAGKALPHRYHRNRFLRIALGVREFSGPLYRLASLLERDGER